MQIRYLERRQPPIRVIVPGTCYRYEATDATHEWMLTQIEGLVIDEDLSFAHLKGTLEHFVRRFFGPQTQARFRPSFFPLPEPSAEVDITCPFCSDGACRICKQTGFIEILGCGMIDPNVFDFVGYDTEAFSGFAFGMGVERIAMLKYGMDDIRMFFQNDVRFLRQFPP